METARKILLVDDEDSIREVYRDLFEGIGFKVVEASCGNDAIEIFQKEKIDVVISDIRMPKGDGIQLLKKVRETNADLPFFLISGYPVSQAAVVDQLNVTAFFEKPFDFIELVKKIRES